MNKKLKTGLIVLIVTALAGSVFYKFYPFSNEKKESDLPIPTPAKKALNVHGYIVKEETLYDEIYINGNLLPDEEVNLSFETSGKITVINFEEGTHVNKGDILAKVNDAPLQAQLRKLEVQLQLAEDRVYRQNALLEKEAVSKEAYEQVQTDLATLQAEIDIVKANIALTELKAPFDGIIGLRNVSEGAYASPSLTIATLTKITPLKIEFSIPEVYAGNIKNGAPIEFSVDGYMKPFRARVYASDSRLDEDTHTFSLRARYPNTDGALYPGRFAHIKLRTQEIKRAIAIPSEAIVPEMGIDKVFLYKAGKAVPVEITKGLRTEAKVQVLKGLNVGDTIITSGTLQLRTGLAVTLQSVE